MKAPNHILTPGWGNTDEAALRKERANKFFTDLDREVFQMKYQRLPKVKTKIFPSIKTPSSKPIWNGITVDNFHIQTKGVFYRIDEVPEGYVSIFRSKGSEYFTNAAKTKVVRVSDHWGYFIKDCDWFLRMQPGERIRRMSSFTWSRRYENKKFIGIIDLNDLSYNDHSSRLPRTKKPI